VPRLGDSVYDAVPLSTPVASGRALTLLEWVLCDSLVGPMLRRLLLLQNGIHIMRELAAQVCRPNLLSEEEPSLKEGSR
jgi:hypothetical protein